MRIKIVERITGHTIELSGITAIDISRQEIKTLTVELKEHYSIEPALTVFIKDRITGRYSIGGYYFMILEENNENDCS